MKAIRLILAATLLLSSGAASSQVYKCKGEGGTTVYSQHPCGAGAALVKTDRAPKVDPAAVADSRNAVFKRVDIRNAQYAESSCIRRAESAVLGPANARIEQYRARIAQLENATRYANNNAAGAAWESGLRSQIAGLEQAMATERTAAEARMDAERAACAKRLQSATEEIERRYAPAPTAAGDSSK